MIKIKRKLFFWPAAIMAGSTLLGLKSQSDANQVNEDIAADQSRRDKILSNQLQQIINKDSTGDEQTAAKVVAEQKGYSSPLLGFVKDLGTIAKNNKKALTLGAAGAGLAAGTNYLTDKWIQKDIKKTQTPEEKSYSVNVGSILSGIKYAGKKAWENKGTLGFAAATGATPLIGYLANKKAQNSMLEQTGTEEEKKYSLLDPIKAGFSTFASHPVKSTVGFIASQEGGAGKNISQFGEQFSQAGAKSGNSITKGIGTFIKNNPKTSMVASIPVGIGVYKATSGLADKVVRKTARTLDKDAFKYQDSQNQEI